MNNFFENIRNYRITRIHQNFESIIDNFIFNHNFDTSSTSKNRRFRNFKNVSTFDISTSISKIRFSNDEFRASSNFLLNELHSSLDDLFIFISSTSKIFKYSLKNEIVVAKIRFFKKIKTFNYSSFTQNFNDDSRYFIEKISSTI